MWMTLDGTKPETSGRPSFPSKSPLELFPNLLFVSCCATLCALEMEILQML